MKWIILFNLGGYCLIMVATNLFRERSKRVAVMGWICAVNSVAVSASPLSIMVCLQQFLSFFVFFWGDDIISTKQSPFMLQRRVIRTKSVEYMPFLLSFFLTLCSTMWFFYGIFLQDLYVAVSQIRTFTVLKFNHVTLT